MKNVSVQAKVIGRIFLIGACALALSALPAQAEPLVGVDKSCFEPAGDPAPGTPEWQARDTRNQYCSTLRLRDQFLSPAFGHGNLTQGASLWVDQMREQISDPSHPRGGFTTLIPGSKAADPFRSISRWQGAGRGFVTPVEFKSHNGSTLRGHIFMPPRTVAKPADGYPGVVITDGSVQAFEELYFWAAQDLAENGYMVMTYDVQGQGDSDLAGEDCPGDCTGVPYQQNYPFYQGAEDSLSFFVSDPAHEFGGSHNPYFDDLDPDRVGVAGHSLGASAVSHVGQCDTRVKTIVAWDNLRAIESCDEIAIPAAYKAETLIRAPALAITNDYGFFPQPASQPPAPDSKMDGFKQIEAAGLDAMIVALRNATHLTYSYIPAVLPANELGERMASYYTLAWFDLQLRGKRSGLDRLTAKAFDTSVDKSSIGAGVFDVTAFDPTDPYSGNLPYEIAGIPVPDAMSFYYRSAYDLHDPETDGAVACADMRKGCAPAATARRHRSGRRHRKSGRRRAVLAHRG